MQILCKAHTFPSAVFWQLVDVQMAFYVTETGSSNFSETLVSLSLWENVKQAAWETTNSSPQFAHAPLFASVSMCLKQHFKVQVCLVSTAIWKISIFLQLWVISVFKCNKLITHEGLLWCLTCCWHWLCCCVLARHPPMHRYFIKVVWTDFLNKWKVKHICTRRRAITLLSLEIQPLPPVLSTWPAHLLPIFLISPAAWRPLSTLSAPGVCAVALALLVLLVFIPCLTSDPFWTPFL